MPGMLPSLGLCSELILWHSRRLGIPRTTIRPQHHNMASFKSPMPLMTPKHSLYSQESISGHSLGLRQHFKCYSICQILKFSASEQCFLKMLPCDSETKQNSRLIPVCHTRSLAGSNPWKKKKSQVEAQQTLTTKHNHDQHKTEPRVQ